MKKFLLLLSFIVIACGCTPHFQKISIPLESQATMNKVKKFSTPKNGYANIYIYRNEYTAVKAIRKLYLNDKIIGKTDMGVFFYLPVKVGKYKLSIESESSNHDLYLDAVSGKNYFIQQNMTMGLLKPGSELRIVSERRGKKDISSLKMAITH